MLNLNKLKIDPFVEELRKSYRLSFGSMNSDIGEILAWAGNLALENLANTDALYHNIDHTIMVTLVGQEILKGRQLNKGGINPKDWLNFVVALLCHDIGYVKGVCQKDRFGQYDDGFGNTIDINENGTSALLTPYHIDRGKLFIMERFGKNPMVDAKKICSFIEMTRFPIPQDEEHSYKDDLPGLVRAADFIGQLGDPNYFIKLSNLFYEFEELGVNKRFGYENPGHVRAGFAKFFWHEVSPYIQHALRYLGVTQEGKEWITNLHSHVFASEHYNEMKENATQGALDNKKSNTSQKRSVVKTKRS
jgi:hypothetical protein